MSPRRWQWLGCDDDGEHDSCTNLGAEGMRMDAWRIGMNPRRSMMSWWSATTVVTRRRHAVDQWREEEDGCLPRVILTWTGMWAGLVGCWGRFGGLAWAATWAAPGLQWPVLVSPFPFSFSCFFCCFIFPFGIMFLNFVLNFEPGWKIWYICKYFNSWRFLLHPDYNWINILMSFNMMIFSAYTIF
jgi:hypothetical protein